MRLFRPRIIYRLLRSAFYLIVLTVAPAQAQTAPTPQSTATSRRVDAVVIANAPIYVLPDANRVPLRTAAVDTVLTVLDEMGEWLKVEFHDPQWGPRVGHVQTKFVRVRRPELEPIDLSVRPKAEKPITQHVQENPPTADPRQQQSTALRMPPGYKWTGISLLAAGGGTILTGAVLAEDACLDVSGDEVYCSDFKKGWIGAGVAMAGAGAIVLAIGANKRQPATLQIAPHGVRWRIRF
jgi:hypothetical protein